MEKVGSVLFGKKSVFAVLVIVALLVGAVFVAFGFDWSGGGRDISWIDDVEDFIVEVRPSEPVESWGLGLYGYYFTLWDNNETELLYHVTDTGNTNDSFVLYMENLICQSNNVLNTSIDEEFAEVFENNRVLTVNFLSYFEETIDNKTGNITYAWFILDDNLNKNLKGTILLIQNIHPPETDIHNWEKHKTLREITK